MVESLQSRYAKNLQPSEFGYPLRFPEPKLGLPESYAEHGLHIGDVGYVDNVGMFEVLFNICFSEQHDLHQGKDLTGLQVGLAGFNPHEVPAIPNGIPSGRAICHGIQGPQGETLKRTQGAPCEFTSSSTSGAILMLPSGATLQNLSDNQEVEFRNLAKEHALKWSQFAHRRSLYLVTGFYKTSSWRLASFHDIRPLGQVLLKRDNSGGYTWHIGCDFRESGEHCKENQTVFISGFKIEVRGRNEHPVVEKLPSLSRGIWCKLWSSLLDWLAAWWIASRNVFKSRSLVTPEDVHINPVPALSWPFHPSDIINRYLLDKNDNARVAITHDSQWLSMLKKNELSHEGMMDENCFRAFLEEHYTDEVPNSGNVVYLQRNIPNNEGDEHLHKSVRSPERFVIHTPHDIRQFIITCMRVENVVTCLRRMPIGFYVLIQFNSTRIRSKCKSASLCTSTINWDDKILLPTDPTLKLQFSVIASFEYEPMLGNGEVLHMSEMTVGKLAEDGGTNLPWGEKASLFITCEEWRIDPPADWSDSGMNPDYEDSFYIQVAKETDKGQNALISYHRGEGIGRLNECVKCFKFALDLCPSKHECYAAALFNYATAISINCQAHGTTSDLDTAIDSYRKVLELRRDPHPDRPVTLLHLAQALLYRQRRSHVIGPAAGEIERLSSEIRLSCSQSCYEYRATDLVLQTLKRYQVVASRKLAALDELIMELESDLSDRMAPDWHFDKPHRLINISAMSRERFDITDDFNSLARSISIMKEAVALISNSHFDKPWMLTSLGDALRERFIQCGDVTDLHSSISMIKDALKLTPDDHFDKPWMLACLDDALHDAADLTTKFDLDTKRIFGIGSFSNVYRCLCTQGTEVAVKAITFPTGLGPIQRKEFIRKFRCELEIWKRLSHPNIAPFLGTARGKDFGSDYPCMVLTLTTNGSLLGYVEQLRITISLSERIKLAKGSAAGLEYLHSEGIVHGDLHPRNVLIDGDCNPRLTDFGLSQVLCPMPGQLSYLYANSTRSGAMWWAAPELMYPELYLLKFQPTLQSDIHSLGSIMLYILSGERPWKKGYEAGYKLKNFQNPPRPTWPVNMPDGVWDFIERCWSPRSPIIRPSAREVLSFCTDRLEQLLWPNLPSVINVVIFGAQGSGKSSIINLLAEKEIAQVSSGVEPCTERPRSYQIAIDNRNFRLWDTMGFSLHEGSASNLLPYEHAYAVLRNIPEHVSLILLCADKEKITPSLRRLYWLVNNFFYGGCAPIAFVVTHFDIPDEEWWKHNKCDIAEQTTIPTQSIPHACVTTDPAGYGRSKHALKNLLQIYATTVAPFPLRLDLSSYMAASLDLATHCRLTSSEATALVEKFRTPLRTLNLVFFGETGCGVSEIVHLLAGHSVAGASPGTISYPRSYTINTGMRHFRIWESMDVDGMDPRSDVCGREELIRDLSGEGGADLLVLCKRFGRLTPEELDTYRSFAKSLGRKAPAAVIVTHFDSLNPMEQWWEMNGKELIESLGGDVIGHACIPPLTSCDLEGASLDNTLLQSRFTIHDMVEDCASSRFFSPPRGIIKPIYIQPVRGSHKLTRKQTL